MWITTKQGKSRRAAISGNVILTEFAINIPGLKWYIGIPFVGEERMKRMEIEEEFLTDGEDQATDEILMEAWPIPSNESLKEFEDYLAELGLRFA